MKKIIRFVVLIIFLFCSIYASDENTGASKNESKQTVKITIENKTVYDVLAHIDLASNILLSWGGISAGTGILLMNNNDDLLKALGIQNTIWGAAEIGAAMWVKGLLEGEKAGAGFDEKKEKQRFQDILGFKFFIDLAFIGLGSAMYTWGNEQVKGHGAGLLIQGFSLAIFDGINFLVSKNLDERFRE